MHLYIRFCPSVGPSARPGQYAARRPRPWAQTRCEAPLYHTPPNLSLSYKFAVIFSVIVSAFYLSVFVSLSDTVLQSWPNTVSLSLNLCLSVFVSQSLSLSLCLYLWVFYFLSLCVPLFFLVHFPLLLLPFLLLLLFCKG